MQMKTHTRISLAVGLAGLVLAEQALANVGGGGGSRIIGTDFLVELYTVATSVWIPIILGLTLVGVLAGLGSGYIRMSQGMSKLVVVVLLGGFGISGFLTMVGGNTSMALVGL